MNRFRSNPSDSLDLLLDTMCNAFGGIILISLLVTLFANETTTAITATEPGAGRSFEEAKAELATAQAQVQRGRHAANDPALRAVEELLQRRDARHDALKSLELHRREAESSRAPQSPADTLGETVRHLNQDARAAEFALAEAKAAGEELTERQRLVTERTQKAKAALTRQRGRQVHRGRPPVERPRDKTPVFAIARYGRIYPVQKFVNGELTQNTVDLRWERGRGRAEQADPIPNQGLDLRRDMSVLDGFLRRLPRQECYVVYLVYADSFAAFNVAKAATIQAGLDYGWEPWTPDTNVVFGQGGRSPAPPL